jgi:hypothetical protein
MRLLYSKHAIEKIRARRISRAEIERTVERPHHKFFDLYSDANVVVREVSGPGGKFGLVVVFSFGREGVWVITVYPVRDFQEEMRRKVNSGRWIPVRSGKG